MTIQEVQRKQFGVIINGDMQKSLFEHATGGPTAKHLKWKSSFKLRNNESWNK